MIKKVLFQIIQFSKNQQSWMIPSIDMYNSIQLNIQEFLCIIQFN